MLTHVFNTENCMSEGVPLDKLRQALEKIFPGEDTSSLARILLTASSKDKISYEEIISMGSSVEDLLFAFNERLLIPTRTSDSSRSIAWEDRVLIPRKGEEFEMPNVVRYLVIHAERTGKWDPEYAVRRYFEDMGDPEGDKIVRLFAELRIRARANRITPEDLKEISNRLKLNLDVDATIAKLKGAGIISPCLHTFIRHGIRYELNPSLCK